MSMDYGKIVKRSWELTRKNKWLWVYGLVLGALGAGGGFQGMQGFQGTPKGEERQIPEELPQQTAQILGAVATSARNWFAQVPESVWILMGTGAVVLILFSIALSWVVKNWAIGGLISGLSDADEGKPTTLLSTSARGISSISPLIMFDVVNALIWIGAILAFVVLGGLGVLGISLLPDPAKTMLYILWGIAFVLTFLVVAILFMMTTIWATRLIVLDKKSPRPAWKSGFVLSRRHFFSTIVMWVISTMAGGAMGCLSTLVLFIVCGVPAALMVVPLFKNGFQLPSAPVAVSLVLLVSLFIYMSMLIKAILIVFNYGTWNLFFTEVMKQENHDGK